MEHLGLINSFNFLIMDKFKSYVVIFCSLLVVSCSSDSGSDSSEEPVSKHSQIHYFVNGVEHNFGTDLYCAFKSENTFVINPSTTSSSIEFSFDDTQRFGYLKIDLNTGTAGLTSNFYTLNGYSSHYFGFHVTSIDEVNHRVKGDFSGYIYSDPLDINSEQKFISGDFDVYYYDIVPYFSGLKHTCKINGADWSKTNKYRTRGVGALNRNVTEHDTSDDEYKLMIKYDMIGIQVGTFNFTDSGTTNMIQLAKFDTTTGQYINYNSTGTLNITQKEVISGGSNAFLLKGTYSLTAVNPTNSSDVITVTDGDFKLLYSYF